MYKKPESVGTTQTNIAHSVVWKTWPLRALPPPPTAHHLSVALFQNIASGFNAAYTINKNMYMYCYYLYT